jgi:hypothetical protein
MECAGSPSLRRQAHGRGRLGPSASLRQGDLPCACSVCWGTPRQRGRGRPFQRRSARFQACVVTIRAADGGDDERATLARNAALHIPTCVRSRHGALWQAAFRVAAHGAVDADPQGSRERRWSRGRRRRHGREKADADDGAWSSAVASSGGGPKGLRPNLERRPPHCSARPCPGRFVRASWFRRSSVSVSILTRTALQNAWSFRERARLARRNSVSTRLMAFSAPNRVTSSSTPHPRTRMRMRCSCGEGEGVKSLWRSILDIRQRVRLEGLK